MNDINNLYKTILGFDKLLEAQLNNTYTKPTFPPYDVIKKDDTYKISIALAGYKLEDIDIMLEQQVLTISTKPTYDSSIEKAFYIHKGIGKRAFKLKWDLMPDMVIDSAKFVDGLLTVVIWKFRKKKPKRIEIIQDVPVLEHKEE